MANKNDPGNFIHECNNKKVEFINFRKSITDIYNTKDIKKIYEFYLNEYQKNINIFEIYGWRGMSGNKGLNKLEGLLLTASNIQSFCMMKSNRIDETLHNMDLENCICINHPRAVMKLNCNVEYTESGEFKIIIKEKSRLHCLFRHLRNSIAHNLLYSFTNGNILMEDMEENKPSARILLSNKTLLKWIDIIKKSN